MVIKTIIRIWQRFENGLAFLSIFLLALIPTLEVFIRKFFNTGLTNSTVYTQHLVLFTAFIGAMITARENKHLYLALDLRIKGSLKTVISVINAFIASMITTAFAVASLSFALTAFADDKKLGGISMKLVAMVMFLGFGVMAIRFVLNLPRDNRKLRWMASPGILFGLLLAFDPLLNILLTFFNELPGFVDRLQAFFHSLYASIAFPLILVLIISAIFGQRIFVVLGGVAYLFFARQALPLEIVPNQAYSMLTSHSIPAIPLFTVTGFILSESRAGERLVKLFRSIFSWFPGGLAVMAILVCAFFTTFTGGSGVTILALGGLLSIVMLKGGYKRKFSLGLLTASGSIGLLFPPSLPIIIYGVIAQVSIKDMFLGGIIPGVLMVMALIAFGIVFAVRNKVKREPFKIREALSSIKESIWEILLPLVVLMSFFGGLTTLVESAAIAVIYVLVIEVFVNRDIKIRDISGVILKSVPIIGGVLIILALANALSYYIIDAQIPLQLTSWVEANIGSKYVFLFLLNIALLITGCFMDIFSAILVVVPLILPLGNLFGIHPVHLGIIFLANMELGYLTPPVGLNLFLASYRFEEPMGKIYRDVLPFFLIQLVVVLLITYLPFLSTGLLSLFGN
jgi:tripartite ATP-independent transporter DctM subunit